MVKIRLLQVLLTLSGWCFIAGIYPLLTSIPQHQQSDYGDQMMLAVYFVLGVFLLLAVRKPGAHRSLIAFTGWGTLAHDAVMAVQAHQQNQLRSELLPLILIAVRHAHRANAVEECCDLMGWSAAGKFRKTPAAIPGRKLVRFCAASLRFLTILAIRTTEESISCLFSVRPLVAP